MAELDVASTAWSHATEDAEREALARLYYLHGPLERRCALLALLVPPGDLRRETAWRRACPEFSAEAAERIAAEVHQLTAAGRLPVFEALLDRSRSAPLGERRALLEGARRVIGAGGGVRPLDRLHWLAMRHRLGEAPLAAPAGGEELSAAAARQFSVFTAFLARIVPGAEADGSIGVDGWAWHARVLKPWSGCLAGLPGALPPVPHAEELLLALRALQAESWMLRPVLMRALVDGLPGSGVAELGIEACDALRLAATLLGAPLPPVLAARYHETGWP